MKKHIENIITSFDLNFNYQMNKSFLKYENRKFTISFSINKTKSMQEKRLHLEEKLNLVA